MHRLRSGTAWIIQRWFILILMVFIPLIRTNKVTDFYVVKDYSVEIFSAILLLFWAANPPDLRNFKLKPTDIAGLGLWALMAVNSMAFGKTYGTWTEFTRFSSLFIIYFYFRFALSKGTGWKFGKEAVAVVVVGGIISAIHGILQFYGYDFGSWPIESGRGALKAAFGNVNYLAGYLGLCLPLAITGYLNKPESKKTAAVCWLAVLTGSFALALTQTRGVWLASAFTVPAAIISYRILYKQNTDTKRLLIVIMTIIGALALGLTPSPVNRNQSVGERGAIIKKDGLSAQGDITSGRVLIWLSSIDMAKKHPLTGVGLGNYLEQHQQSQASVMADPKNLGWLKNVQLSSYAHNEPLQFLCELGLPGLLLYIGFIWFGAASFFRSMVKRRNPLIIGAGWACAESIIDGLTSFPLHIGPNALVFFMLMASVVSADESQDATEKAMTAPAAAYRFSAGFAALLMAYFATQWYTSNVYFRAGEEQFAQGNFVNAVGEYKKAAKTFPVNPRALLGLGIANSNLGNTEEARKYLSRPLPNVDQSIAWDALGAANFKLEHLNDARNALETGRFLYPTEPRYYANLSTVYYLLAKEQLERDPFLAEYYLDQGLFDALQYTSMTKNALDISPFVCGYRELDEKGILPKRPMPQRTTRPFYPGADNRFFEIIYPYIPVGKPALVKAFLWTGEPIKKAALKFAGSPDYPALAGTVAPMSNNGACIITFVTPALSEGQYPIEINMETAKGKYSERQVLTADTKPTPKIGTPEWSYK